MNKSIGFNNVNEKELYKIISKRYTKDKTCIPFKYYEEAFMYFYNKPETYVISLDMIRNYLVDNYLLKYIPFK